MTDNVRKPSARERRAAEARRGYNARVSVPRASAAGNRAPRERRPAYERNDVVLTDRRSESLYRRHDDAQGKDDDAGASRKRSRDDKGKDVADGEGSSRQRRASTPRRDHAATDSSLPSGSKRSFGTAELAASHLSKIVFPGTEFPPPEQMSKKSSYSSMALNCMTFLSSLNEVAIDYEVTARSLTRQLANAQKAYDDHKKLKRDAEDRVVALEAAMKEIEDRRREMDGTFTESESERKRLQKEVSDLTARLDDAAKLQDAAVPRAVDEAKRELSAKYEARIVRATEKIRAINGQPRFDIIDLAEVRSNIEFVKLLQSDEAPDLGEELVELEKQEADLSQADKVFAKNMRELEGILKDSPVSTTDDQVEELDADVVEKEADSGSSSSGSSSDNDSSDSEAVEIVDDAEETAP